MLNKYWRAETGIFLVIWVGLMIGGQSRFIRDPGTFWHTVVGEQMLTSGEMIYRDTFSFTCSGQAWSPHQWLGECMMAILHRLDGLDTLLVATVTILSCLYTVLAHRFIREGLHWNLAGLLVALTVAASSSHFHIRPHIATIAFMGITYAYLTDFEARRIEIRQLFWLLPIFLLWTNIHGGMLGGLCTVILVIGGWGLYNVLGLKTPVLNYSRFALLVLLIAGCALTALINPYGTRLPGIWLEIMDSAILPQIIQEHASLNPGHPDGWMVIVFGGIYLTGLLGTLPRWPRVTWLVPLIWAYLAWSRIRHSPLFAITAAIALADMLPHTRWAAWLARKGSDLFQYPREKAGKQGPSWRPALVPVALILITLGLQITRQSVPVIGHGWAQLDADYWPVDVLPDLKKHEFDRSDGTPIFNEYLFGGYLIYHTPGYRVFVDDRCELYGDKWLLEYVRAEENDTEKTLIEWERRYPTFDLALTRTGSGFDEYFSQAPAWKPVKQTKTSSLYQRN